VSAHDALSSRVRAMADPVELAEDAAVQRASACLPARHMPAVLLRVPGEAAAAMAMSEDSFQRYVQPEVPVVRLGRMKFVAVVELEAWAGRNASLLPRELLDA
jgi:hypothetical protein